MMHILLDFKLSSLPSQSDIHRMEIGTCGQCAAQFLMTIGKGLKNKYWGVKATA